MGRKRKSAVYGFFSYEKETNESTCLVDGCSSKVKGQHGTNLMYHLSKHHPDEYNIVQIRNKLSQNENDGSEASNAEPLPTEVKSSGGHTKEALIEYLKTQCINLVTVHGRPFSLIDDLAFQNIIKFHFSKSNQGNIHSRTIRNCIAETAQQKRAEIAAGLKGRLISIKIDSATRLHRTFFAVNAQYIQDGCIKICHLGVSELHSRSTGEYLKEKLLIILRKYNIDVEQIYTITSDNGRNMLKITKLINESLETEQNNSDSEEDGDDYESDYQIIRLEENDPSNVATTYSVTSVRCAAHTLQLAVNDALAEVESIGVIEECRSISRKLRTPTMRNVIKASKTRCAILDVPTRWHSTLDMLERVTELKEFCSETYGDPLYMSNNTWNAIEELILSLKPAKILTKILQTEQLTIGDFYLHWCRCYIKTSRVLVPLAQNICMHMKIRQIQLMTNSAFVSGLYLDPRFHVVLSPDEESLALEHLNATWIRIVKQEAAIIPDEPNYPNEDSRIQIDQSDTEDEIESVLLQTEQNKRTNVQRSYVQLRSSITPALLNFSHHPRIGTKDNILAFWRSKFFSEPQLSSLANVVLSTPTTQVSVERLFSSLKFVLNDLRYNLNESIVEDILVLRNNSHQ